MISFANYLPTLIGRIQNKYKRLDYLIYVNIYSKLFHASASGVGSTSLGVGGFENYKIQLSSVGHNAMGWKGSMETTTSLAELLFCRHRVVWIIFHL